MHKDKEVFLEDILDMMKAQFGHLVKAFWVYDGELCPCCQSPIDEMIYEGKKAVSINVFMYREKGALIAYLLCGPCAEEIMAGAKKAPGIQTELHTAIEKNLADAYLQHLNSLDA